MKSGRHATEMDQLLHSDQDNIANKPSSSACRPQTHYYHHGDNFRRRRRILLTCISLVTLLVVFYLAIPRDAVILFGKDGMRRHQKKGNYDANNQREELNELTESALRKILTPATVGSITVPSSSSLLFSKTSSSHNNDDNNHNDNHGNNNYNSKHDKQDKQDATPTIYQCTSHLLVMRHCEKQVEISINGEISSTDKRDFFGDRHCNARGKERSAYIATLFEDPEDYLVEDDGAVEEVGVGANEKENAMVVTPIPMVSSSSHKKDNDDDDDDDDDDDGNDDIPMENKDSSIVKPLFPSPYKLYALSTKRDKHKNYREVETVEPLADKFHLDVDDRFGVKEEGDLAWDFFNLLADSVAENVGGRVLGVLDGRNGGGGSNGGFVDMDRVEDALENTTQQLQQQQQQGHGLSNDKVLEFCNDGMTVVNWKHSRIPKLANALGCGKEEGCPKKYDKSDFDTVWLLTFEYSMMDGGSGVLDELKDESERRLRQKKEEETTHSFFRGDWKISARVMNEGFDDE
ncbi:hypothetical protein ACHAXS_013589 [Conticribra weissflogii]